MSRKKFAKVEGLEISDLTKDGKGIAKKDGLVYFVDQSLPGDIVDIQPYRKRKSHILARRIKLVQESEKRIKAKCEHFGTCGGCTIQNLNYKNQLKIKQKLIHDAFQRIAGIIDFTPDELIPAPEQYFYRNKLEFTFSNNRWLSEDEVSSNNEITDRRSLGFHIPGRFDRVLDLNNCYLQKEPSNIIRNDIRAYTLKNNMDFYNLTKYQGKLRNLIIRTSNTGENMLVMVFGEKPSNEEFQLLNHIKNNYENIHSIFYIINEKLNSSLADLEPQFFHGQDYITEKLEELQLKIGPKSFYQTNSTQALTLYRMVRDFASPEKNDIIYDLYCGTGSIALFLANACQKVIGIESVDESVEKAIENATYNKLENAHFYCGIVEKTLDDQFIESNGNPDVVILDPPRNGLHKDLIDLIKNMKFNKLVYVSCNPSTQARDVKELKELYEIKRMQGIDMFPHTMHVENLVLLERRS